MIYELLKKFIKSNDFSCKKKYSKKLKLKKLKIKELLAVKNNIKVLEI